MADAVAVADAATTANAVMLVTLLSKAVDSEITKAHLFYSRGSRQSKSETFVDVVSASEILLYLRRFFENLSAFLVP